MYRKLAQRRMPYPVNFLFNPPNLYVLGHEHPRALLEDSARSDPAIPYDDARTPRVADRLIDSPIKRALKLGFLP